MQDNLHNVFRSDLWPLEVKWACICARKELRFTQDECFVRNPGCCFWTTVRAVAALVLQRFNYQLVERG